MSEALFLVVIMLGLGYAAARFNVFERSAADVFHRFVIYVCLPALIWKLLPTLSFQPALWVLVLVPWLLLLLMAAVVYGVCTRLGWSREICGALLLCVPLGNTSFLGFPLIAALLGEDAVKYAVVYDQLGSFVQLSSYGLFVVAYFGGGKPPTLREALLRAVRFPPFIAFLLAFTPLVQQPFLQPLWARLGDAVVPLAMFAVGLRLEFRPPRPRRAVAFGLVLKLLVMPLLAFAIARVCSAPKLFTQVAVLEAATPSMITAGAMAMAAGLAPELCAALVGYGVLLGVVTMPLIAALLNTLP